MKRVLVILVLGVGLSACSRDASPSAPSSPYPSVAGTYSGTVTIGLTAFATSLTCPATTTVTQSDATVTFTPLTMSGNCAVAFPSLPLGSFAVSSSGSLGSASQNGIFVPSCNGNYNATQSGGFSGSTFQFSLAYTAVSGGCVTDPGSFTIVATLSK